MGSDAVAINKTTVDHIGFNRAMTEIQRGLNIPLKQVIRSEVGIILKDCAGKTKVVTEDDVIRRAQLKAIKALSYTQAAERGQVTVSAGWRRSSKYGTVWMKAHPGGGKKAYIQARSENFNAPSGKSILRQTTTGPMRAGTAMWLATVQNAVAKVRPAADKAVSMGLKAIGLARQSWVQIARSINIDLNRVPGGNIGWAGLKKAELALASDGKYYNNGTATEQAKTTSFIVSLVNSLPYCRRAKLDSVLIQAINRRTAYFSRNLSNGVFGSAKKIVRKYPGLFVSY